MKNFTNRILSLLFAAFVVSNIQAQGTSDGDFIVRLMSSGIATQDYTNTTNTENCGWGSAAYGAAITDEFCGEMVWVHDNVGGDSLACDSIAEDLTGKIAVIRRGACEFGAKTLWAEKAGAIAVIIINHYSNAAQGPCTTIALGAGAVGAQVTIPCIFFPRSVGEIIDAEIVAGRKPQACYLLPRMADAIGAYAFATPVAQIDSLFNISVHYFNRTSATQTGVVLKANISGPNSYSKTLSVTTDLGANTDTIITFPAYKPPYLVGDFTIAYSNNKFTESRDTMYRKFRHTLHTYATDNFVIDPQGVGPTNTQFITNSFKHQVGSLYLTGPSTDGVKALSVSFGIANKDSVYVAGGDPGANDILAIIYDADLDENGEIDLGATWEAMDDNFNQVGYGTYTLSDHEVNDSIVSVSLRDLSDNPYVQLKPGHPYYVSLKYDGLLAGTGRCVRFSNTLQEQYLNFPTTPVFVDQMYSGWAGATVIQRLEVEEGVWTKTDEAPRLDESKVVLTPNPATDNVNMDFKLAEINKAVTVRMMDWTGNVVKTEIRRDFQNGRITFNTNNLPSGAYVMWVSSNEGTTIRKVMVCH